MNVIRMLFVALLSLLFSGPARADTASDLVGLGMQPALAEYIATLSTAVGNAEWIKATNQAGTASINMLRVDATDDTVLNADSGDVIKFAVATTPIAAIGSLDATGFDLMAVDGASTLGGDAIFASGKGVQEVVAVVTPNTNFTPVAASNIVAKVSRLVSGSPTLAGVNLPAATAAVGKAYTIINEGANPVAIAASGTDTVNALAAATPYSCAAAKICDCLGASTTNFRCSSK